MSSTITIENVGGIRHAEASFDEGLNVVKGANWKGKTSFIHGIEAALGIPVSVTEGETTGTVRLRGSDYTATVELQSDNGSSTVQGTPLLSDETARTKAELFACLGESNPIRSAVRNGDDLESILTRPLDLENIDRRIGELKSERDSIDTEIAKAENSKNALPQVKERIANLESQIDSYRSKLATLETDDQATTDDRDELSRTRSERNRIRSEIERLERSIDRYEEKIENYESQLSEISIEDTEIDYSDIEAKKSELDEIRSNIKVLETLFTANNLILEENSLELVSEVEHGLETDAFQCWVCGNETTREDVEQTIDQLQQALQTYRSQLTEAKSELNELETEYERYQQQQKRKQTLENDIQDLQSELADKKDILTDRRSEVQTLEEKIDKLSSAVDESVEQFTDLESELKFKQSELEEAKDELEKHQRNAYRLDELQSKREKIREELADLRDRKDQVKQQMRKTFHETITDLVDTFETGFESARLTSDFELVVARRGREAQLDALSEGELEILGFVATLAGYEAFDVSNTVPFLLLDGLEALSDENLHTLVEYFEDRADYLIVTAHPEHTDFSGHQIDTSAWETVTSMNGDEAEN